MDNEMFERNLPPYLAHDLEAWKKGVEAFKNGSLAEHSSVIKSGSTIKSGVVAKPQECA